MNDYMFRELSYEVIGIGMRIHRLLGKGFLEIVYKDAFEYELHEKGIAFEREKQFAIQYRNILLPHRFQADFVIDDKIILEVKAKAGIIEPHYAQVINYLAVSKLQLGLILNFNASSLQYKRVILSK